MPLKKTDDTIQKYDKIKYITINLRKYTQLKLDLLQYKYKLSNQMFFKLSIFKLFYNYISNLLWSRIPLISGR